MTQGLSEPTSYSYQIKDPNIAKDVKPHWAFPFIYLACSLKLIPLYQDGTFRPVQTVSRGQLALFFKRFSDLSQAAIQGLFSGQETFLFPVTVELIRADKQFSDVSSNPELTSAVSVAYRSGFLNGFDDGTFRPNEPVSRVQLWVAIANLCESARQMNIVSPKPSQLSDATILETLSFFSDGATVPSWARRNTVSAAFAQSISGFPDVRKLRPNDPLTRADLAASFYSTILNYTSYRKQQETSMDTGAVSTIELNIIPAGYERRPINHNAIVNFWGFAPYDTRSAFFSIWG